MNPRAVAARALSAISRRGQSLDNALEQNLSTLADARDRGLCQELCYGVMRWYPRLNAIADRLLQRPLKAREHEVRNLILIGLYQLGAMNTSPHAAVAETVAAARQLDKDWATGLINALLRNFQRRSEQLANAVDSDPAVAGAHPRWLFERLQRDWPDHWRQIVAANNTPGPMTLRVDRSRITPCEYREQLAASGIESRTLADAPCALVLRKAVPVTSLPGFTDGLCSVQDAAAQQAAHLLDSGGNHRVLDACAAPGGKTGHILELAPSARLTALDHDGRRLGRVQENLERLGQSAQLIEGSADQPRAWWDGQPFDRILLDAPCSATGVIRRHPDIKQLRRNDDIKTLSEQQVSMLSALWPLLTHGGMLLYCTCSILRDENENAVHEFLTLVDDARERSLDVDWGHACRHGRQILPGEDDMDGFFYALIEKT